MKLSASRLILLLGSAVAAGALAPEPSLLIAAQAVWLVAGIHLVGVLHPSRV